MSTTPVEADPLALILGRLDAIAQHLGPAPRFLTVDGAATYTSLSPGSIRRMGEPQHRIDHVIRSRGIRPAARAGILRLFTEADVRKIASELRRIDEEREGFQ